jgi:hypothetical protein
MKVKCAIRNMSAQVTISENALQKVALSNKGTTKACTHQLKHSIIYVGVGRNTWQILPSPHDIAYGQQELATYTSGWVIQSV